MSLVEEVEEVEGVEEAKGVEEVEGVEEAKGVEDYHVFINSLGFKPQAIEF